jgi:amino acid adenylation domain-containing protein
VTLHRMLEEQAKRAPLGSALLAPGRKPISYRRLLRQCEQTVSQLNAAGIGRGDRLAVVLSNGPEMAVCFLALAMGAACAPLNPSYREAEFEFYLDDLRPRALIVHAGTESPAVAVAQRRGIQIVRLHPALEDEAGVFRIELSAGVSAVAATMAELDDEALVLHTSGTTARPKMVPLTAANLTASARNIAASLALTTADRCLNVMPLFHIHGLVGALLASLAVGGSVACAPGFQAPRFLDWCEEFEPTWYTAVPTIHQAILARALENRSRLAHLKFRFIRSCSAALPPHLMAKMEAAFGVPLIEAYGMTEASHQITTNPLPPGTRKPGSVGLASGCEIAVMDHAANVVASGGTGEILLRGPGVTSGYAENPEANRDSFVQGWFRTGDEGNINPDGYLFITGRIKEMINRGGQKISPREIDDVLGSHPAVAQALAFAMPDSRLGENVAAAVVLRPGERVTETQLKQYSAELVADYKVPRRIVFLDEIPKGPTGKLKRIGVAAELGLGVEESAPAAPGEVEFAAPSTATELMLAEIGKKVLEHQSIGINDSFFALGGDSILAALAITRIRDAIGVQVSMLTFFDNPTIAALGGAIDRGEIEPVSAIEPIVAAAKDGELPLSSGQRRVWLLAQLDETGCAYNRCDVYRLRGNLDACLLTASLGKTVERHSILRTTYHSRDGEPFQIVRPSAPFRLDKFDLMDLPASDRMRCAVAAAGEEVRRQFDLSRDPMLRARLIWLEHDDHILVLTMHHIASDGWSSEIILGELGTHYGVAAGTTSDALAPMPLQYADFAVSQSRKIQESVFDQSLGWWSGQLAAAPALLALPTDRERPSVQNFQVSVETLVLPKEICDRLGAMAREHRATLFMALLSAFYTLLHRYSGADDIVVGTPIAGRMSKETEGIVGLFVNMLGMRGDLSGNPTFRELLQRTRRTAIDAFAHQEVPFEKVVEALHPQRNPSYAPVFQTTFQLRNYPLKEMRFAGLSVEELDLQPMAAQFDLSLEVTEKAGSLHCSFIYSTALFNRETIAAMARHFETLLAGIVSHPDSRIERLPMLTEDERRRFVVEWNGTRRDYPFDCLHHLFERQAAHTPHAIAAEMGTSRLSYAELDRRSNQAANLLYKAGVRRGSIVGLFVDRSLEMYVGILAILKAGGAYVPLDPSYPPSRLDFMLEDSGASVLVTIRRYRARTVGRALRIVELDDLPRSAPALNNAFPAAAIEDAAYVIYTSGSTGAPKGVVGSHRGMVNRLHWMWETYPYFDGERACQKTALSFVDSVAEIFGPLLKGVPTSIIDDDSARDPRRLVESLARSATTRIVLVPSLLEAILALPIDLAGPLDRLRTWTSSGEVLRENVAKGFFERLPQARLLNLYGSSEVAADATAYEVRRDDSPRDPPIGKPIANTRAYLLGPSLEPVPIGVVGEIYISGAGVAIGYHDRPDLNAARFIADPFAPGTGERVFRTGDLGRYSRDGGLNFVGRADNQVKVSGVRIEPEEVEAALRKHPDVKTAAVSTIEHPGSGPRLAAWVVARTDQRPSATALREFLTARLPSQIVPSSFAWVDNLPETPSGKIDRVGLAALSNTFNAVAEGVVEPRDDIESQLRPIWEEVLGVAPIGVNHDFFDLGGHSLMAARLLAKIEHKFAHNLPLAAIFQAPTIDKMARLLRDETPARDIDPLVPIQPLGSRPPLYAIGSFNVFRLLAQHMGDDQPVLGVAVPNHLRFRLPYNIEQLAAAHVRSILNARVDAPVCIAGYSADGVLAYEVARRLAESGRKIGLLVLLDTECPAEPDPLLTRVARNGNNALNTITQLGFRRSLPVLQGILRRMRLRAEILTWRGLNRLGIQSTQPTPERPIDAIFAMVVATRSYTPQPYRGRVLLFKRTQDLTGRFRLPDCGWSRLLQGESEIVEIPGDHLSLIAEPSVAMIAEKLNAAIRDAEKTNETLAAAAI